MSATDLARGRDSVVWDAVNTAVRLNGADEDEAVAEADRVIGWMKAGIEAQKVDRRLVQRAARRVAWKRVRGAVGWLGAVLAVAFALGNIPYWIVKTHENDYGGTDPNSVPAGADYAIRAWYGQNDLPSNLTVLSQTHSKLYGKPAWLVRYSESGGGRLCVFVWGNGSRDGAPHGTYTQIDEGCKDAS